MTTEQIKALQTQLNQQGANLKVDGILGPLTTAAMNQFATASAGAPHTGTVTDTDGMTTAQIKALQTQLNASGANLAVDGILGPQTTAAMNSAISKAVASNPDAQTVVANNSPDAIVNAYMTGDWSGVTDVTGQPFSTEQQQAAISQAQSALAPGFQETQAKDTADTAATLGEDQQTQQNFLNTEKTNFQSDKSAADQSAATNGVLFTGARTKALQQLGQKYQTADQQEAQQVGNSAAQTANNFQYAYGAAPAASLSQYYNLGSNNYNPNVAVGGATSSPKLSSYYNPSAYNYQGTTVNANNAAVQTRAAGLLSNTANKLSTTGYQTQF